MKHLRLFSTLTALFFGLILVSPTFAYGKHQRHNEYAKVVEARPVYQRLAHEVPQQSCHYETVTYRDSHRNSYTGTVVGGLLGAAIGHELGHSKRNKDVAAVAGINYEYAVASVDVFGLEGSYSPFAKIFLPVNTRVISTCTLRKVATGVELGWESEMAAGADAIVIYRKKSGDPKFQKIASVSKSNVNFIDKTVQKNTLYIYLISAEKNSAPLAKSEEKNFQF